MLLDWQKVWVKTVSVDESGVRSRAHSSMTDRAAAEEEEQEEEDLPRSLCPLREMWFSLNEKPPASRATARRRCEQGGKNLPNFSELMVRIMASHV